MAEPSPPSGRYVVDRLAEVTQQIQRFVTRAKELGMGHEVLNAFVAILDKLETTPLEWGDPEYATKTHGGMVMHGVFFPFIVRYVAFERDRVVCILRIGVLSRHPLASD